MHAAQGIGSVLSLSATPLVARLGLDNPTHLCVHPQSVLGGNDLTVDRIFLVDKTGKSLSAAALAHRNDFAVVYDDETFRVLENRDVMPRAFIVHSAQAISDEHVLDRLQEPDFQPERAVLLSDGAPMDGSPAPVESDSVEIKAYRPEEISMKAQTAQPGYLVLADTWLPGWRATVDGNGTQIMRADYIFFGRSRLDLESTPLYSSSVPCRSCGEHWLVP